MALDPKIVEKLRFLQKNDPTEFKKVLRNLRNLSTSDLVILRWHLKRRPSQICPTPIPKIFWLLGGRGSGKALDLNTPLPTPTGWVKMGNIVIGDSLIDEKGVPCIVTAVYDVMPEKAYELTFSDHSTIIAGSEHLWVTSNVLQRRKGNYQKTPIETSINSTEDIVKTLFHGNGPGKRVSNHSIALQGALQLPERDLPVDPWLLGFWLGDGSSVQGKITVSDSDLHLLDHLNYGPPNRKPGSKCATYTIYGLTEKLRPLGVIQARKNSSQTVGFKHVPDEYHRSSENQRLELLKGLMDSDGFADINKNTVEFSSTSERLADDVMQLARSLGEKPVKSKGRSALYGVDKGPKFRVTWCPTKHNPFRLARKANRLSAAKTQISRRHHRMIKGAVEVPVRPMRCITVNSPNHMYLAGEQMVPTHNTYTASNHIYEFSATLPFVEENSIVYIALIGSIFDDVKATMIEGKSGLLKIVPEEDLLKWNRTNGELSWKVIGPNGEYREVQCLSYTSEKPDKLRGPNTHLVWIDEYAKFKDANEDPQKAGTTWDNMMKGLRNGTHPHVIVTGTPTDCRLSKYLLQHKLMKLSHMTTVDNKANLPESYFEELMLADPNSRSYRQEVLGELIFDNPDAIFTQDMIDNSRSEVPAEADIVYKVLGYDPAMSSSTDADECGIILTAFTPEVKEKTKDTGGRPRVVKPTHAYILKDLSGHYTPYEQTQLVIQTILNEEVNDLVYEQNQGVEFVMQNLEQALKDNVLEYNIRKYPKGKKTDYGIVKRWGATGVKNDGMPFKFMIYAVHATSQKKLRAEMVSSRYDSGQIHHPVVGNPLPTCEIHNCRANLETQMTSWNPKNSKYSPDRLDAMAYCMLHIFANFMITRSKVTIARPDKVVQQNSQHQAVRRQRKGLVGIYSTDMSTAADAVNRSMISQWDSDDPYVNPYMR